MNKSRSVILLISTTLAFASAQQNGDIRLEGGTQVYKGRLEIFFEGQWGNICYDSSSSQKGVAQTACRQLGYNDCRRVSSVKNMSLPEGTLPILLKKMSCPYTSNQLNAAQHILRCGYQTDSISCAHSNDMGIECDNIARNVTTYDTMVDILNEDTSKSSSISSGYAQVYLNEQWGPVCNMKKADADSFCRQLSYTSAVSVEDRNATLKKGAVLSSFGKCDRAHSCLRNCFSYPKKSAAVDCGSSYSFVTCTYDTQNTVSSSYGTKASCTVSSTAGIVFGCVLAATAGVFAILCLSCWVYRVTCYKRKQRRYEVIS